MTAPRIAQDALDPPGGGAGTDARENAALARNRPRRVALYARVSTKRQDPAPQLVRLRAWAAERGFAVALEETDVATGKNVQRPGFEAVMRAARAHHVHMIAVVKVDRMARSVMHLASTVQELHGLSVDFYAIDQGIEVRRGSPTAELVLNIFSAVAQWEGQIISERTRDSLDAKREAGQKLGPAFLPCHDCGADRMEEIAGKRSGKRVPLCSTCKEKGGGSVEGMLAAPSREGSGKGGPA